MGGDGLGERRVLQAALELVQSPEHFPSIESSFGEKKYARLQALKAEWDPDNLFCHNQNIKPA